MIFSVWTEPRYKKESDSRKVFPFVFRTATSPSLMAMARIFQMWETKAPTLIWVERVASFSNPADGPSRKRVLETASELGAIPITDPMKLPTDIVKQVISVTKDPLVHLPVVPW